MIVIAAIFIGILTAALGAFTAGFVAMLAVDWYHIPSREGGSGYFVAFIGLIGIVVGFMIGIVCGCGMHADTGPGFFKALGLSLGIILFLSGTGCVITRLYADVPPKLRGERMFLIAEAKWPATRATSPALEPGDAYLLLGSLKGHTLRKSERGQLWKHRAVLADGQWVVRGAVEVFTSRGKRLLDANLGAGPSTGLLVPLPAFPGSKYEQWSDWMPRRFHQSTPDTERTTYRFRVQRRSEPMHVEDFGNFQITTFTNWFHDVWENGQPRVVSGDSFNISYRGKPVKVDDADLKSPRVRCLINLPETTQALLAIVAMPEDSHSLFLLRDTGNDLTVDCIITSSSGYATLIPLAPIEAVEPKSLSENRRQIVINGLYFIGVNTIFDTRILKTYRYSRIENTDLGDFRPLMLSPDERSFVRFTFANDTQAHMLTITDFVGDRSYSLPIDRPRMRYVKVEYVDRAWAEHHFKWERDAGGIDQLVARADFPLLPFKGELGPDGDKRRAYYLYGSNESIGPVLENVLVEKFAAQRQPPVEYQVDQRFLVNGAAVRVFASSNIASVSADDPVLMNKIADALNAELTTYKHDALFSLT